MRNWTADLCFSTHSADGQWRVIDLDSDNGDVIAIVDPDGIADDLENRDAEQEAQLIAAAPALAESLKRLAYLSGRINSLQHAGMKIVPGTWSELFDATNAASAALAKAGVL